MFFCFTKFDEYLNFYVKNVVNIKNRFFGTKLPFGFVRVCCEFVKQLKYIIQIEKGPYLHTS